MSKNKDQEENTKSYQKHMMKELICSLLSCRQEYKYPIYRISVINDTISVIDNRLRKKSVILVIFFIRPIFRL